MKTKSLRLRGKVERFASDADVLKHKCFAIKFVFKLHEIVHLNTIQCSRQYLLTMDHVCPVLANQDN